MGNASLNTGFSPGDVRLEPAATCSPGVDLDFCYLTCDDQGQKPTGKVVSTGNGGEVVSGPASIGAGLLLTNPLDYTAEIE